MAPLWQWLGIPARDPEVEPLETGLAQTLDGLKPPHARYLAAYAAVLARVAYSDRQITPHEAAAMTRILCEVDAVAPHDAELIVAIASDGARRLGAADGREAARLLGRVATRAQRLGLLRSVFAVAIADGSMSLDQLEQVERIGHELGLSVGDVEIHRTVRIRERDLRQQPRHLAFAADVVDAGERVMCQRRATGEKPCGSKDCS